MRKFLRIIEYFKNVKLPLKENYEYEFTIENKIYRTSICEASFKEQVSESFDPEYNDAKVGEQVFELKDVVIYDDMDINSPQDIVYTMECPICLNTIISNDSQLDFCPRCGNEEFPLEVKALINTAQMEEIAIDNKDVSSLVIVKDDKIQLVDKSDVCK